MADKIITNWDKVKEEMVMTDGFPRQFICDTIHKIKNEETCHERNCFECKFWLKQPYKEPSILDEAEKKYLSAVIRPWRDKVKYIQKEDIDGEEFIGFQVGNEWIEFPNFDAGTMYKEMELYKEYTLDDLDL